MKTKTETLSGLTLCIAVCETDDNSSSVANRVYDRIRNSLINDAAVIYNGNDETVKVPFLARMRQMHPDFVEGATDYDGPFDGYDHVSHIVMIDGARCQQDQFIDELCHRFSPDIVALWCETLKAAQHHADFPVFLGKDCVAMKFDLDDDSWFEMIINDSTSHS